MTKMHGKTTNTLLHYLQFLQFVHFDVVVSWQIQLRHLDNDVHWFESEEVEVKTNNQGDSVRS